MALQVCLQCGTRYAVAAPWCPGCTSTRFVYDHDLPEGEPVPKVTVLDGASSAVVSADLTVGQVDLTPEPVPDVPAGSLEGADFGPEGPSPVEAEADAARAVAEEARGVVVDFAEIEAEEEPCPDPGTDSQTSSPKPDSTPPPNDDSDPSPARTAGNPSKTGRKRRG